MKSIEKTVKNAGVKYPPLASPTGMRRIVPTAAASPEASVLLNRRQAEAATKIFVYAELMLAALDDFHVHNRAIRRQKLTNLMRNTRKEMEHIIGTLFTAPGVGQMSDEAQLEFYDIINMVEAVHKEVYRFPISALPELLKQLTTFNQKKS